MNSLLNSEQDEDIADLHRRAPYTRDREITLGTTMVLGIFFALAVLAAASFGLGYSMGAKHSTGSMAMVAPGSGAGVFAPKPAPGSPLGSASAMPGVTAGELEAVVPPPPVPRAAKPVPAASDAEESRPVAVPAVTSASPAREVLARTPAPLPTAMNPTFVPGAGQSMVQVAAVSHQEDADLLLSTLRRRGYSVAIHTEPQDKLLHVQIGPFATRKDADAMRQRLLADGFNAIVKQ